MFSHTDDTIITSTDIIRELLDLHDVSSETIAKVIESLSHLSEQRRARNVELYNSLRTSRLRQADADARACGAFDHV